MAPPPPRGIYVPVPTFFASASSGFYDAVQPPLDLSTQCTHAIYLARAGIRGLILLGSTGEAVHINNNERTHLISGVRKALDSAGFHDYPLLAGTATQSVEQTVGLLEDARNAGAQWGMVLAPGYFASAVSQDGIAAWFEAVADRSVLPILVYHYPAVSNNVALLPNTMERLAQHPKIVGCKLSHGNLDDHALIGLSPKIDHSKFHVFTGLGQQLIGALDVGGAGAIDGLAACFPRSLVELFRLFETREQHGATTDMEVTSQMRQLQYSVCQAEKLVVRWGTIGIREALARMRQIGDKDGGRWPLKGGFPKGDVEWESWREAIDALHNLEIGMEKQGQNASNEMATD